MRTIALITLLLATALLAAACGGPDDGATRLAEACERQVEEVALEQGSTPTAKSTNERLDETTLVECAGQNVKTVAADADAEAEADAREDAEANPAAEDPGSGGDSVQAPELDPASRTLFADTCGACHTLSDAETSGSIGPVLDEITLDSVGVRQVIQEGRGAMPPNLLEGEEAEAVAEYVATAAAAE